MNDFTSLFLSGIECSKEFSEAFEIIKKNTSYKIWLIGGMVYRTIVSQLYGIAKPKVDIDFIGETRIHHFNLPEGWNVTKNHFGNPKLVNGEKSIDYVPLPFVFSILYRNCRPTIENYLSGVPLTIQSIAYDLTENKVIGKVGMKALEERTVEVNNFHFAEYAAHKKGKTITQMIQEKADSLDFIPLFTESP